MSLISAFIKSMIAKSDKKRDEKFTIPKDVTVFRDLNYKEDKDKNHLFDIYKPRGKENVLLPVLVNVHGGGYIYGTKETYQFYCASLAQMGFTVISFNYTLAPKKRFPTQLSEINDMFTWIMTHDQRYSLDLDNIIGIGDSAGTQLLAEYTIIHQNEKFAALFPFKTPENLSFKALLLNCGIYEFHLEDKNTSLLLKEYLSKKGLKNPETIKRVQILDKISPSFPPSYILTAEADFLKPESENLDKLLTELGVDHIFRCYEAEGEEKLQHVFHCDIKKKEAREANRDEMRFVKEHIDPRYSTLQLDPNSLIAEM